MDRRSLLKLSGGIVGFTTASGIGSAAGSRGRGTGDTTPAKEREYDLILPGDKQPEEDVGLNHYFKFDNRPVDVESNVGGKAVARPRGGNVELELDLTEEDKYSATGVHFTEHDLDDITEIQFKATDTVMISLHLGIEYNDGVVFEWEQLKGNKRRFTGFGGDDRALAKDKNTEDSPIQRDERVFRSPWGGAYGEDRTWNISINDISSTFGNIPVRVGVSIDAVGPNTRSAEVEELDVIY